MKNFRYTIILIISLFTIFRVGCKLLDSPDPKSPSGLNHVISDVVQSESAYDVMSLVCYKSIKNVSKIYPNIENNKIGIYIYDGDFTNEYGTETMAYFYRDSILPLIVINKNSIIGNDIETTLTHELLHYADHLNGRNGNLWSEDNIDLNIIDKKISDPKYFTRKVFHVFTLNYVENIDKKLVEKESYRELMKYIKKDCDNFNSLKDYYESPEELFVRINLLKLKMFDYGVIKQEDFKNLESGLSRENIKKFIGYSSDLKIDHSYYTTIYSLKWNWENEN